MIHRRYGHLIYLSRIFRRRFCTPPAPPSATLASYARAMGMHATVPIYDIAAASRPAFSYDAFSSADTPLRKALRRKIFLALIAQERTLAAEAASACGGGGRHDGRHEEGYA